MKSASGAVSRKFSDFLADKAPMTYVRSMLEDDRGTTDAVWKGLADLGVAVPSARENQEAAVDA